MPQAKELAMDTGATYPGRPEHISSVRADLRILLNGCPILDDILLCVSELATNAILHSRSGLPGSRFIVRSRICPTDRCVIEVQDDGGGWAPAPSDPGYGHGLAIVQALATEWGIDGDHTGRTVWARFDWLK
jgi:serine/threonine-protein kinase RsbW